MYIHIIMEAQNQCAEAAMALFPLPCACQSLRRLTRLVTRIYDQELRKADIEITQFGLLMGLATVGQANQKTLSAGFAMDSTTLTRTLALLHRQSWIRVKRGKDRRERVFSLTETGKRQMFFALTNAIFDAGIVAWEAKRIFDSVRPVTAIPYLFHGQLIRCWGGPGRGTVTMDGSNWIPYQQSTFPTPPFPEYTSGHSTFSAAGASILALWTGSEHFGASVTFAPGSSFVEPGITPASSVTLHWKTFHDAANQAGLSRRYGGIHFRAADLVGRATGDMVAVIAWAKALEFFGGRGEREDDH